jgi:hypothetical protein
MAICAAVIIGSPLSILPCKDSIENLCLSRKMSDEQNSALTFALTAGVFLMSVGITNIGDAMLVIGATAVTAIGFNLPMLFYVKMNRE